jgi:hypothetical protein
MSESKQRGEAVEMVRMKNLGEKPSIETYTLLLEWESESWSTKLGKRWLGTYR